MTAASVTDPNGDYSIKPGAFVGFDYSTTALRGGVMLVASPNGKDKIPKLGPDGLFMFSIADGDNMWLLLKDKVQSVLGKVTWDSITGKPDVATKADVATVAEIANKALNKANSNATALNSKVNKSDLTWANISGKPSIPNMYNGVINGVSTDFNTLTTEGHYDIQIMPSTQSKRGPSEGNWGLLDVKVAGRMVVQTYYADQDGNVWVRNRYDGSTWTSWRQVTFWPKEG
nr:pyocin knob domain-containing protein [Limosilactobacillus mucosae]